MSGGSGGTGLTLANGNLFFLNNQYGTAGLYQVNAAGTAATRIFSAVSSPTSLTQNNGVLYFFGSDPSSGVSNLYKSDGTATGTKVVAPVQPSSLVSSQVPITGMGSNVYFTAYTDTTGAELWKSDGTATGTVLVKDIRPGAGSSRPQWLGVVGGRGYFMADDGVTGTELWSTDGTEQGTIRVSDINPGPGTSNPWRVLPVDGGIVFVASDGVDGQQWYRFEPENVKPTVAGTQFTRAGGKAAVVVDFDEAVSGSLAGADLVVTNLTTGQALDPAAFTVAYDPANNRATFTISAGMLPDGNYRVTLAANGVRDTSGNPLAADGTLDFFMLAGDANGDRTVNFADLLALAKNYGKSGVGLAEGDFNGDGVVNFADLLMLAKNYNKTLDLPPPPPPPAPVMAAAAVASKTSKRQASPPAKPLFSMRPVVARPAPVKRRA